LAKLQSSLREVKAGLYVSPSIEAIERLEALMRGEKHRVPMILFGNYAGNRRRVDWKEQGAWLSYDERQKRGLEIGPEYDLGGVNRATSWQKLVEWLERWNGSEEEASDEFAA
jgi:hypothetical protein